MSLSKDSAIKKAKKDLAKRLDVTEKDITVASAKEKEFPDMSLGSPTEGEMSAQMISSGWAIELGADGKKYEYRADKYQLRLHNFKGRNHIVES